MLGGSTQHQHITKLILGLCVFGVIATTIFPSFANAQPTPRTAVPEEENEEAEQAAQREEESIIADNLEGTIYNIAVGIGGFFVWVGGGLLDYAINEAVVGMGDMLRGGVGVAVDTLWTVIRDAFNILFIFGLIYIGFRTILKSDDAGTKRAVALLIVAALLINFSLFITKAIVDFSNLMSYQVYQVIIQDDPASNTTGGTTGGGPASVSNRVGAEGSISNSFMDAFNLTTYAQSNVIKKYQDENPLLGGRIMFYGLLMMFVMLIAAFVFAAGAFMLIARFVALVIFMILSPAMFLGFIFPLFEKYQTKWWDNFLKYAFVGPAYLFMLYLSLFVIWGLSTSGSFAQAFEAEAFSTGAFIVFLNFFIIAGFLIASLVIARELGVHGATASVNILNRAKDRTLNYGKRVAGNVASRGYNVARYPDRMVRRAAVGGASNWGLKKFNEWQTRNENTLTGQLMSGFRVDRSVRDTLEAGRQHKAGLKHSYAENQAYDEQTLRRQQRKADEDKAAEAFDEYREKMRITGAHPDEMPEEDTEKLNKTLTDLGKKIRNMSQKELEASGIDFLSQDHVVLNLTSSQIEQLEKSEKYTQTEVNGLKDKRKEAFLKAANHDRSSVAGFLGPEFITNMKPSEIAKLPADVLLNDNVAQKIPTSAVARIAQDRTLSAAEERQLREKLEKQRDMNIDEEAEKMRQAEAQKPKSAFGKAQPDLDKVEEEVKAMRDRSNSLRHWLETPVARGFGK